MDEPITVKDTIGALKGLTKEEFKLVFHLPIHGGYCEQECISVESLQVLVQKFEELLKVAKCPACDGSGQYPAYGEHGEPVGIQCEWCFKVKEILETT
jgi:hypothetical protein